MYKIKKTDIFSNYPIKKYTHFKKLYPYYRIFLIRNFKMLKMFISADFTEIEFLHPTIQNKQFLISNGFIYSLKKYRSIQEFNKLYTLFQKIGKYTAKCLSSLLSTKTIIEALNKISKNQKPSTTDISYKDPFMVDEKSINKILINRKNRILFNMYKMKLKNKLISFIYSNRIEVVSVTI